ncbi:MAG: hypothetical protein PHC53_04250 [Patescibacteria group bacterium]|nr:hypothetical protein [Patescibacteria group bacterium]
MPETSLSIKAIELTRAVFESVHGNLGLLKFNIEELTPTNGVNGEESKKWRIICSFYETLGSSAPSRYQVDVNLNDNTVTLKKLGGDPATPEAKYVVRSSNEDKPL